MAGNAQTITFDEPQLRHGRSREERGATGTGINLNDGIVFSRTISQGRVSSRSRTRSLDRHTTFETLDGDNPVESGLRRPQDYKSRQVFRGRTLFFLAYQSIGVIYGDIGTSPLYVYSSTFSSEPNREDLIGVLSLIIWSLLWMVTLKYVIIILHADNEGEGGTFSCYSLLSRYANITSRDPREESLVKMERYKTEEMHASNLKIRDGLEKSKFFKNLLRTIGVLAVSMVMSDGILTPAQSVLGAVQGLNVLAPNITNSTVVGTTCGILVLLFLIQPFGTTKIGVTFAPIIILWLGMLAGFGIYNLVWFDWRVLKAFNPGEGFMYLVRNGHDGWLSLGGILLAFTGVEALFADLGAFSMRAIQLSWLCYCLPCLLLAYIGQAAYISVNPAAYAYPVFNTAPPNCVIPIMVLAILAAIVASQAIITATFQLVSQIIKLSYLPTIQVIHTSTKFHNHIYVPLANFLMMIGTVAVTAGFNNTTSLGNAYGVCVMFVTFFDTCMVALAALLVWRIRPYYVFLPWLAVACVDGTFLSSALVKVPQGAWFTISLAALLTGMFILWRHGKEAQWAAERDDRKPLTEFISADGSGKFHLKARLEEKGGERLSVSKGFGVFFDKGGINTPMVFSQFINKLVSTPEVIVFFHLRPLEIPTVPAEDRFVTSQIKFLPNCYRVVCRHGYMDEVITPDLATLIFANVHKYVLEKHERGPDRPIAPAPGVTSGEGDGNGNGSGDSGSDKTTALDPQDTDITSLTLLQMAFDHRVLYVIGKEEMRVKPKTVIWRLVLLKVFLFMRDNTRNKMANLKVPTDRLIEIGFVKDV